MKPTHRIGMQRLYCTLSVKANFEKHLCYLLDWLEQHLPLRSSLFVALQYIGFV